MSKSLKLFLSAMLTVGLFFVGGCGEELAAYDASIYESSFQRAAEEQSSMELTIGEGECDDDADAAAIAEGGEAAAADAEACFWVQAFVTIGGVTVVDWVWVCGGTVTVWIPNDPALIGLPIKVVIPGVGTACGTVTL